MAGQQTPTRSIAIGDIHGCDVALQTLLAMLAVSPRDELIVLGDAVDRGPNSSRVLEMLVELSEFCTLQFIMGNHEEMMLQWLVDGDDSNGWLGFGGRETLSSYGDDPAAIPESHVELLKGTVPYLIQDKDLCVHANLEPDLPIDEQEPRWLRWTHLTGNESPWPTGQRVLCGHTPQRSGEPLLMPGWVCLDTFAYGGGWLSGLDLRTGEIFQANQLGRYRTGWLPE